MNKPLTSINYLIKNRVFFIFVLCVVAIFLRILSFGGYFGSDDGAYAELACKMANNDFKIGEYSGPPVFPLRLGLIVPVALLFKIFGISEINMVIYPFLLSMLSIIVAFYIGRMFFGVRAGLIAATLQAILPIDVRSASVLLPDLPAAFWANFGVLFLLCGLKRSTSTSKIACGVFSGLAFGLSLLCKESALYLFPFIFLSMIWVIYYQRNNATIFISAGLTVAAVFLTESLIYYIHTDVFPYRLHILEKNYEVCKVWFFTEGSNIGYAKGGYLHAVLKRILKDGPMAILMNRDFGMMPLTATIAIGYAIFRKLRPFLLPSLWFISLAFMFNFGSSSIKSYLPLPMFDRYLYPLLLPAIVLTGGLINVLMPSKGSMNEEINRERLFWGSLLTLSIIFICIFGVHAHIDKGINSPVERAVSRILSPTDKIYTDSRTAWVLKFFWKYPKETQTFDFSGMGINDLPTKTYVLINRNRADFLNSAYGYVLPKFYSGIPGDWVLKWGKNGAELYWIP